MKKNTYKDTVTPAPVNPPAPLNDPKHVFIDGRIWSENGGYWIPEDEPVMVLRGKDQATISAILGYIECLAKQVQTPHVREHIESSRERLQAFMDFQRDHPSFIGIGCGIDEKLRSVGE